MSNEIERYLNNPMVKILGGAIELRDDRIKTKWKTEIKPFLLAPNPVTVDLYNAITNKTTKSSVENHKPVVNVSWNDAISFCNLLSQKSGLKKAYVISDDGEHIIWDRESNGYRLPTEAEWQYVCKAETTGYQYGELDKIAWYNKIQMVSSM